MILAGRRINDGMAAYVANDVIKTMLKRSRASIARVLVMGFTFKENVPDTRNTKVVDLVRTLRDSSPRSWSTIRWPISRWLSTNTGSTSPTSCQGPFDAVILAVKHDAIAKLGETGINALLAPGGLIYDLKGILPP